MKKENTISSIYHRARTEAILLILFWISINGKVRTIRPLFFQLISFFIQQAPNAHRVHRWRVIYVHFDGLDGAHRIHNNYAYTVRVYTADQQN